jgi:hypothetical protein
LILQPVHIAPKPLDLLGQLADRVFQPRLRASLATLALDSLGLVVEPLGQLGQPAGLEMLGRGVHQSSGFHEMVDTRLRPRVSIVSFPLFGFPVAMLGPFPLFGFPADVVGSIVPDLIEPIAIEHHGHFNLGTELVDRVGHVLGVGTFGHAHRDDQSGNHDNTSQNRQ